MNIIEIKDFYESCFMLAFRSYFQEIGIILKEETDVFDLITKSRDEEGMRCFAMLDKGEVIAFIMFQVEHMQSNFFKEELGFIREFFVKKEYRVKGIGSKLLRNVEAEFKLVNVKKIILTYEENALGFYSKKGYKLDLSYKAKNEEKCVVKEI